MFTVERIAIEVHAIVVPNPGVGNERSEVTHVVVLQMENGEVGQRLA